MIKKILTGLISFTVLPIAVSSVQLFSSNKIGGTAFWWAVQTIIILLYFASIAFFYKRENRRGMMFITIYLIWNIFSIIRGFFIAETYWDFKGLLGNTFALLMPVVVYIASDKDILQSVLSFFVKYALPFSLVILLPLPVGAWGWYLFPICFLLLFFPNLKGYWKILLLLIAMIASVGDLSARSHVIKYMVPILILGLYYFRFFIAYIEIIKVARTVLLFAPWIFLFLGVSGTFNVFKINEYMSLEYTAESTNAEGEIKKQSISDDSRTFMYRESLMSAKKHNYWWLGRSPARGNDSEAFGEEIMEITGRRERLRNEAGIPNFFNWTGIIGVVLYFLIFFKATSLAIYYSNNFYSKLIGLFVAFHWTYTWVENTGTFTMNTFTILLLLSACFSNSFRRMNDLEIKLWARGIFDKKYARLLDHIQKDISKDLINLNRYKFEKTIFS